MHPAGDPSFGFARHKLGAETLNLFKAAGTNGVLNSLNMQVAGLQGNKWRDDVQNEKLVDLVTESITVQNAVTEAPTPGFLQDALSRIRAKEQAQDKADPSLVKPEFLRTAEELIQARDKRINSEKVTPQSNNPESAPKTSPRDSSSPDDVPGFLMSATDLIRRRSGDSQEAQAAEDNGIDFTSDDKKYTVVHTWSPKDTPNPSGAAAKAGTSPTPPEVDPSVTTHVDFDPTVPEAVPASRVVNSPVLPDIGKVIPVNEPGARGHQKGQKDFNETVEASGEKVEKVSKKLFERTRAVAGKLGRFGLVGLTGTLEGFGKLSPRTRLALGVGFAGASVLTGGGLSAAAFTVSSLSYASGVYKKNIDKMTAKGLFQSEERKHKAALRAAVFGTVLSVVSLVAWKEAFMLYDAAVDSVSNAMLSIHEHFTSPSAAPVPDAAPGDVTRSAPVTAPPVEAVPPSTPSPTPAPEVAQSQPDTPPPAPQVSPEEARRLAEEAHQKALAEAKERYNEIQRTIAEAERRTREIVFAAAGE